MISTTTTTKTTIATYIRSITSFIGTAATGSAICVCDKELVLCFFVCFSRSTHTQNEAMIPDMYIRAHLVFTTHSGFVTIAVDIPAHAAATKFTLNVCERRTYTIERDRDSEHTHTSDKFRTRTAYVLICRYQQRVSSALALIFVPAFRSTLSSSCRPQVRPPCCSLRWKV